MDNGTGEILVLVEGARTDVRLMEHLLKIYGIDHRHRLVSYNTNIYALYNSMFRYADPSSLDILLHLKSRESDPIKKAIFDKRYSEILLIFDFEPHDPQFSEDIIREMAEFFIESTDMGKLYINYPMVEAFYHMKNIPDHLYDTYSATIAELASGGYKERVNRENRNRDYTKFAADKRECDIVIRQNINKARKLLSITAHENPVPVPDSIDILNLQLDKMQNEQAVAVLCTCAFYIVDYNPGLIGV